MSVSGNRLWNVREVAEYLNVPEGSVYKMTYAKASVRIPHVRISGRLRFRQRDVDEWLELLTVSNLDTLKKAARMARRQRGIHSQEEAG